MSSTYEIINDNHLTQFYFSSVDAFNQLLLSHWHNHLEIIHLNAGHMTAYINDTAYELMPGDILIINSNDIHYTHAHGECNYYLLQIPVVHLERLSDNWKLIHFDEFVPKSIPSHNKQNTLNMNRELSEILDQLYKINCEKKDGYHLLLIVRLYELLHLLYTNSASLLSTLTHNRNERDLQRIEACMQYAKQNFRRSVSLNELAEHISVAPEYLCRLFKKYTGQTFFTYLAQIRMLHFYQELVQTQDSITYLLEKNGITNYKQFMRMFKETYGMTPKQLRKTL